LTKAWPHHGVCRAAGRVLELMASDNTIDPIAEMSALGQQPTSRRPTEVRSALKAYIRKVGRRELCDDADGRTSCKAEK